MKYNVLVALLGMTFSSVAFNAYADSETTVHNNITYSYDFANSTLTSAGSTLVTAFKMTSEIESYTDGGVTYMDAGVVATTYTGSIGTEVVGERRVAIATPVSVAEGETNVVLGDIENLPYSSAEQISGTGNQYYAIDENGDIDEDALSKVNSFIAENYTQDPGGATSTQAFYTLAQLKGYGVDITGTDFNGDPFSSDFYYIYARKRSGRKWLIGYVPVTYVTYENYSIINKTSGYINLTPNAISAAFLAGNTTVESITIPSTIASIAVGAFKDCTNLNSFTVSGTKFTYANGILYNKSKTEIVAASTDLTGSVTIPSTVTKIWDYAFVNNKDLVVWYTTQPSYNQSTQGTTKFMSNKPLSAEYIEYNNQVVGIKISGTTTMEEFAQKAEEWQLSNYNYVDMKELFVTNTTQSSPLDVTPATNQVFVYDVVNTAATYYVNVNYNNVVYYNNNQYYCKKFVLDESASSSFAYKFFIPVDFYAEDAVYTGRTFTSGKYASLILPYSYDEVPDNFEAYKFASYDATAKRFNFNTSAIYGNEPCLVKALATGAEMSGAANVKATTALTYNVEVGDNSRMVGVYRNVAAAELDGTDDSDGRDYVFTGAGKAGRYSSSVILAPFRAYIHLPQGFGTSSSAKSVTFNGVELDEETAVDEISTEGNVASVEYFTTSGAKIDVPQKGCSIVKTIFSDGKVEISKMIVK